MGGAHRLVIDADPGLVRVHLSLGPIWCSDPQWLRNAARALLDAAERMQAPREQVGQQTIFDVLEGN